MLKKIFNLFRSDESSTGAKSKSLPPVESCSLDLLKRPKSEVPKEWDAIEVYPPLAKSIPTEPIDGILYRNRERILQINEALGLSDEEFERFLMPVIRNFANFVHLLPASEAHHHRGTGGALRHALEVAFWSARAAEDVIFCLNSDPVIRRKTEPLWRVATCIAGLLHDAGKPIADLSVRDEEGNLWHPLEIGLYDWLRQNRIEKYYLTWREGRYKRHETFTQRAFDRIVPAEIVTHFMAHDPKIMYGISDAFYELDDSNHIGRIITWADHESTRRDAAEDLERKTGSDFNYGLPVHRHLFSSARRMVSSGKWSVNKPGAKVWHCKDGTFIVWKHALPDLIEDVKKEVGVTVRNDPDGLADELIQRNMAYPRYIEGQEPKSEGDLGNYYLYWVITPKILTEGRDPESVKLTVLKLDTPDRIFANDIPGEAEIKIWPSTSPGDSITSPLEGLKPEQTIEPVEAVKSTEAKPKAQKPTKKEHLKELQEDLFAQAQPMSVQDKPEEEGGLNSSEISEEEPDEVAVASPSPAPDEKKSPLEQMLSGNKVIFAPKKGKKQTPDSGGVKEASQPVSNEPVEAEQEVIVAQESEKTAAPDLASNPFDAFLDIGGDIDFPFAVDAEESAEPEPSPKQESEPGTDLNIGIKKAGDEGNASQPVDEEPRRSNPKIEVDAAKVAVKKDASEGGAKSKASQVQPDEIDVKASPQVKKGPGTGADSKAGGASVVKKAEPASSEIEPAAATVKPKKKAIVIGKHRKKSPVDNSKDFDTPVPPSDPIRTYEQFILDNHGAGKIIEELVSSVVDGGEVLGARWFIYENRVTIAYPLAFESSDIVPLDALAELEKNKLLYSDPKVPMRKVLEFDEVRAIALNNRASSVVINYLIAKEKSIDPHNVPPHPDLKIVRGPKVVLAPQPLKESDVHQRIPAKKSRNSKEPTAPRADNTSPERTETSSVKRTISRKEIARKALNELFDQMIAGDGHWLTGYSAEENRFTVSKKVVERMIVDYPQMSMSLVKQHFWSVAQERGFKWHIDGSNFVIEQGLQVEE